MVSMPNNSVYYAIVDQVHFFFKKLKSRFLFSSNQGLCVSKRLGCHRDELHKSNSLDSGAQVDGKLLLSTHGDGWWWSITTYITGNIKKSSTMEILWYVHRRIITCVVTELPEETIHLPSYCSCAIYPWYQPIQPPGAPWNVCCFSFTPHGEITEFCGPQVSIMQLWVPLKPRFSGWNYITLPSFCKFNSNK